MNARTRALLALLAVCLFTAQAVPPTTAHTPTPAAVIEPHPHAGLDYR